MYSHEYNPPLSGRPTTHFPSLQYSILLRAEDDLTSVLLRGQKAR